jgi:hypothetical protein
VACLTQVQNDTDFFGYSAADWNLAGALLFIHRSEQMGGAKRAAQFSETWRLRQGAFIERRRRSFPPGQYRSLKGICAARLAPPIGSDLWIIATARQCPAPREYQSIPCPFPCRRAPRGLSVFSVAKIRCEHHGRIKKPPE